MKIYYISGSTIPSDMANAVHVMKMCQAFAKAGHEVTLFGKAGDGDGDAFDRYGVQSHFDLCLSPHRNIKYVSGVERVLYTVFQAYKRGKPDVFYGRDPVALALLSTLGVPCIFEAHQLPTSALQELCVRRLIAQTGKVVCISEALKQDFREMFPEIIETRVLVAHDGADLPEDGLEMQAPELPDEMGCPERGMPAPYTRERVLASCWRSQTLPLILISMFSVVSPRKLKRLNLIRKMCFFTAIRTTKPFQDIWLLWMFCLRHIKRKFPLVRVRIFPGGSPRLSCLNIWRRAGLFYVPTYPLCARCWSTIETPGFFRLMIQSPGALQLRRL